jgi:hypothetical protein
MKHGGTLARFLHADGRKRAFELKRYAPARDGAQRIGISWEGEQPAYGDGTPPDVQVIPKGDQALAEAYAEFIGACPMRLANALEDLNDARRELARFNGEAWRGRAIAVEDTGHRGGIWLYSEEIATLPEGKWSAHFGIWFASWEALADILALSPCGVGVAAGGTPFVRLAPYRKPKGGDSESI